MKRYLWLAVAGLFAFGLIGGGRTVTAANAPSPVRVQHTRVVADGFIGDLQGDWSPEARKGWDLAVAALSAQIKPGVPVEIIVTLEPLEPNVLGRGGAMKSAVNFPGAIIADTWYPIALANQVAGERLAPGPDAQVHLNSIMPWDYSGNPKGALAAGKPDFVTTLTHEILHGMGINGTARVTENGGEWGDEDGEYEEEEHVMYWSGGLVPVAAVSPVARGLFFCAAPVATQVRSTNADGDYPDVYDHFVVNGDGDSVLDRDLFPDPSQELNDFLTSDDVFWSGEEGMAANDGKPVKLFAPDPWQPGSSYAHFDDGTYDGGIDALMTAAGAKIPDTSLGPRLVGMLRDIGWDAKPK